MMNTESGFHVTPNPAGGGWAVQSNNAVVSTHDSRTVAIDTARKLARRYSESYTIHRKDGVVISTKSYEVKSPF
jgi:hypothetical protein